MNSFVFSFSIIFLLLGEVFSVSMATEKEECSSYFENPWIPGDKTTNNCDLLSTDNKVFLNQNKEMKKKKNSSKKDNFLFYKYNNENEEKKSATKELKRISKKTNKKSKKKIAPSTLKEEKGQWYTSLSISPIKFSRIQKGSDITMEGDINYDKGLHEFRFHAETTSFESTDPINKITVKSAEHSAFTTYDFNNFFGKFTFFLLGSYLRKKEGNIYLVEHRLRGGPLGVKYIFYKGGENVKDINISFIPLYEFIKENIEDASISIADIFYKPNEAKFIRNSIRLRIKLDFLKGKISFKNTSFYRPAYSLDEDKWKFKETDFENNFKMTYKLDDYFSFTYKNKYVNNVRSGKLYGIPSTDVVHTFLVDFSKTF